MSVGEEFVVLHKPGNEHDHPIVVWIMRLTMIALNMTKNLLHYQYLPWHEIVSAIQCSKHQIFIGETISLLEKRCQINRDAEFLENLQ